MMVEQQFLDDVRQELIKSFERFREEVNGIELYEKSCSTVIDKLKNREPIKLEGPLAGEPLDAILYRLGIHKGELYFEVWRAIEEGR